MSLGGAEGGESSTGPERPTGSSDDPATTSTTNDDEQAGGDSSGRRPGGGGRPGFSLSEQATVGERESACGSRGGCRPGLPCCLWSGRRSKRRASANVDYVALAKKLKEEQQSAGSGKGQEAEAQATS